MTTRHEHPEAEDRPRTATDVATTLVDELVAALINVRIYAETHPRVTDSLAALRRIVAELAQISHEDPVAIGCADGLLIHQKRPLLSASLAASRLIEVLDAWGSGGIELSSAATADDLRELLALASGKPADGETHATLNQRFAERGRRGVRLLPTYTDTARAGRPDSGSRLNLAVRFYQTVVDLLQNITVTVCRGGRIQFDPVRTLADQVLTRLEADDGPLMSLARHDQYDAFTFGHSVRVAVLAMNFARSLTDDRELIVRIGAAALLHDVGKALIPFEILHLNRRLTAEEFREMSRHAQLGAELLLDHHDSDPLAIAAAFGHHQTEDNRGYPKTAHMHRVSMVTEIVKICDVYEALTAARPYKRPMSPVRAYRVMLSMGDKFDSAMLRRFIEANGIFPVGQMVELDSGELAVVRRQNADPQAPIVELMTDTDGAELAEPDRSILDLSDLECCARTLLGEADPDRACRVRDAELLM